jgi:outer membrane protein OmpA-like peptidoglycan-associated protein
MAQTGFRVGAALVFLLTAAGTARAQGFALDRFDPSERGSEWFANESLDFRSKAARPAAGMVFEGQYRPLAVYNTDGSVRTEIVRHVLMLHPGASVVFFERVRVGLSLPIALFQDGTTGTFQGVNYPAPGTPSLGDLRVGGDVRLFGDYDKPLRVAIGARMHLPTGNRADYNSDGVVRLEPRAMASGDYKMLTYAARIGFQWRNPDGNHDFAGGKIGSELNFSAAIGARVLDKRFVIGPEIFGSTVVTESGAAFSRRSTPLELMLGAHYTLPTKSGDIRFGMGFGTGLTRGFGSPLLRYLFDIEWALPVNLDRDGDGILDQDDACPDVPGIKTGDPATNGCPENLPPPPIKPPPPPPPPSDKDGDGIVDTEDACVDVPGVKTDDPKTNGCPPDKDGDKIVDADDACPDVPGVPSPDKRFNGCPPDKDGDGIANEQDACPDEPGKPDADPKKNGCPTATISGGVIKLTDQVKFKTASSEILPGKDSQDVLDAVLKILKDHTEIKKLRVEGHTDNKGAADYNKTLSGARAQSVVDWLVQHGIAKDRLTSQGFGMEKPIDSNETEDGRRNNRRVEFHIEDKP